MQTAEKKEEKKVSDNLYAVIEVGSKQFMVKQGTVIDVDNAAGSYNQENDKITFSRVLLYSNGKTTKVGTPHLKYKVKGVLLAPTKADPAMIKGPRVIPYKYKKRKGHHRNARQRRQKYMRVQITEIGK